MENSIWFGTFVLSSFYDATKTHRADHPVTLTPINSMVFWEETGKAAQMLRREALNSKPASNPKAQGKLEEAEIILDARRRILRPRHHKANQEQHSWVSVRARQARGSQALNGEALDGRRSNRRDDRPDIEANQKTEKNTRFP